MVKKRSLTNLRRREAFKAPNKFELIACEGSTEEDYFKALIKKLRLPAVKVKVYSPSESEPIKIVNWTIAKRKEMSDDVGYPCEKAWCVIDVEIPQHQTLDEAWEKANATQKLEIILTNPCIEYWFLLHFKKHTSSFDDKDEVMNELLEVHPTYKKRRIGFNVLDSRRTTAIQHSREILVENECGDDLRNCNPSTHIHIVVEHLENISCK